MVLSGSNGTHEQSKGLDSTVQARQLEEVATGRKKTDFDSLSSGRVIHLGITSEGGGVESGSSIHYLCLLSRPHQSQFCTSVFLLAVPSIHQLGLTEVLQYLLLVSYRAQDKVARGTLVMSMMVVGIMSMLTVMIYVDVDCGDYVVMIMLMIMTVVIMS